MAEPAISTLGRKVAHEGDAVSRPSLTAQVDAPTLQPYRAPIPKAPCTHVVYT